MSEANPFIISEASESRPQPEASLAKDSSEPVSYSEFTRPVPPNKRLQATRWFLTYPQVTTTKEEVLKRLQEHPQLNQLGIKGLMIAQEKHKDNNLHIRVGLWLNKKLSTRNRNYFDFVCE